MDAAVAGRTRGTGRDRRAWSSSLLLGVAFAAGAMAVSLLVVPAVSTPGRWGVTGDLWMVTGAARTVWSGALGYVYQNHFDWYSLPLSAVLLAPVVGLGDHLGLVDGWPAPVAHPTMWLLVEPYTLLFGIFFLHALRKTAWELGARRRLWLVQLAGVAVVLAPAAQWGHFEDVIALTCVLHALRALLRSDPLRSPLWLAAAISSKQWAVMVVPFVVLAAPAGRRLRAGLLAASLPAAFAALTLSVDWPDASRALLFPSVVLAGNPGHAAFFAHWFGTHGSVLGRALAVLASPAVAWRTRRWRHPAQLLAALSFVLTLRALMEPVNFSYYWSPGLATAVLAVISASRSVRRRDLVLPVAASLWTMCPTQGHTWMMHLIPTVTSSALWWAGEIVLLGLVGIRTVAAARAAAPGASPVACLRIGVKVPAARPILQPMSTAAGIGEQPWTR